MDGFLPVRNSMFASVFDKRDSQNRTTFRIRLPSEESMNNLSHISCLYTYTNPPPAGTGVAAPKIAETVLRANNYNLNSEKNKWREIKGHRIARSRWVTEHDGVDLPFPLSQIHGNYHPRSASKMFTEMIVKNKMSFDKIVERVIERAMNSNPDVLTKGRQTWCSITRSSLPSATAFNNVMDFFQENLNRKPRTSLEYIRCIHELFQLNEIKGWEIKYEYRTTREKMGTDQRLKTYKKKIKIRIKKTYTGEEAKKYLVELVTSFAGYMKLLERGKKDCRAIASANMFLRMYLDIIEQVHLEIGKVLPASTISIGGDEKKNRIMNNLLSCRSSAEAPYSCQATQDATKWNECLSPELFALFSYIWLGASPEFTGEMGKIFYRICMEGHMFLALKRIFMGDMPQCVTDTTYNRPELSEENLTRFNSKTQKWMKEALVHYNSPYLSAPNGMLMGMHNALSTTVALTALPRSQFTIACSTLRSSDDSTTVYIASNYNLLKQIIEEDIVNHKMIGVNPSTSKNMLAREGFAEYTSWYMDDKFLSQYGTDVTQLRPGGKNPYDDFNSMMRQTAVAQIRLECNSFGAGMRIPLCSANVKRLYRIDSEKRVHNSEVSGNVRLHADGGSSPFAPSNCHLDEIALKRVKAITEADQMYLKKVCTIDNPFCNTMEEEITWSKSSNRLVIETVETPRNMFTYQKRNNRTLRGEKGKEQLKVEMANSGAIKILQLADPGIFIAPPNTGDSCINKVIHEIRTKMNSVELEEGELRLVEMALLRLEGGDTSMWEEEDYNMDLGEL